MSQHTQETVSASRAETNKRYYRLKHLQVCLDYTQRVPLYDIPLQTKASSRKEDIKEKEN